MAKQDELATYLAADMDPGDFSADVDQHSAELDDSDIFVEVTTARFLAALGVPVPDDLAG